MSPNPYKIPYDKNHETLEAQVERLASRGMVIENKQQAIHYLGHLNYYRLSAYWLGFEDGKGSHSFRLGTTFSAVLNLYVFDRELRLLVMDAIERVEVSIRTRFAYHLSELYGPHPHLDKSLFKNNRLFEESISKLKLEARHSREVFIRHFDHKYSEPLPPVWAAVELMSLGQLSKWFQNIKNRRDRNLIARNYGMNEVSLRSLCHHLAYIRNICAHHARLWDRHITITFALPVDKPSEILTSLNRKPEAAHRIYNTLAILAYMMDLISPHHHWKSRLNGLIEAHSIEPKIMGFPTDWKNMPVWQ